MKFSIYQASRIGGRKYNQDRVAYAYSEEALLMVLADGMGGHLRGEMAAQMAIQTFMDTFRETAKPRISDPEGFIRETMQHAHQSIVQYAREQQLSDKPGTTCVVALVQGGEACWAHAGDSRLYLLRDRKMAARTRDHSLVQQWADTGVIRPQDMKTHPDRNKITNCLSAVGDLFQVDFTPASPLQSGDVLLLCSDGLWSPLADEEIAAAFIRTPPQTKMLGRMIRKTFGAKAEELPALIPVSAALEQLMDEALKRENGRADNTTAVAARWGEAEEDHATPVPICKVLDLAGIEPLSNLLGRTQGSTKGFDAS
jgi:serine/threonine protein phosphatase PrpC